MKELGIKYVRIGEFMWSTIEKRRNLFNYTIIDTIIEICNKHGVKIF
jgi:beta-galactosidase